MRLSNGIDIPCICRYVVLLLNTLFSTYILFHTHNKCFAFIFHPNHSVYGYFVIEFNYTDTFIFNKKNVIVLSFHLIVLKTRCNWLLHSNKFNCLVIPTYCFDETF